MFSMDPGLRDLSERWRAALVLTAAVLACLSLSTTGDAQGTPTAPVHEPDRLTSATSVPTVFRAQVSPGTRLALLFSGSRNSKVEPCGCRGRNLGGVDKEGAVVDAYRSTTCPVVCVDAGGFFREFVDEAFKLQTRYLLEALSQEGFHAVNVGYRDLTEGLDYLLKVGQELRLPLVSANIVREGDQGPVFEPYRLVETVTDNRRLRLAIIGVTAPNVRAAVQQGGQTDGTSAPQAGRPRAGGPYRIVDEIQAAAPLARSLRRNCDILILLSFAPMARTREIAESIPEIDLAIAGEYQKPEPAAKTRIGQLIVSTSVEGKMLGCVEIGLTEDGKAVFAEPEQIPLDQALASSATLHLLVERFQSAAAALRSRAIPTTGTVARTYAGARQCMKCHVAQHSQWKATRHAKAMASLVEKQMHFNADCLRCHTVGFREPGGFTDLRVTPHLANVQCENCHGPCVSHADEESRIAALPEKERTAAVRASRVNMRFTTATCTLCHDTDNDPEFDFARDIRAVLHDRTERHLPSQTTATRAGGSSR